YAAELADDEPTVARRARSRLDVVAEETRRATVSGRSGRGRSAVAVAGAIGLVLAVAGLMIAEIIDDKRR
ncbi:MAG: hypothetical protein ABIS21_04780, partial [Acidimicrobiales bacterium]